MRGVSNKHCLLTFFIIVIFVDSLSADAPNVCKGLVFSPKFVTIWLFYFDCILLLLCVCFYALSPSLVCDLYL